jgi:hypothetical protein
MTLLWDGAERVILFLGQRATRKAYERIAAVGSDILRPQCA